MLTPNAFKVLKAPFFSLLISKSKEIQNTAIGQLKAVLEHFRSEDPQKLMVRCVNSDFCGSYTVKTFRYKKRVRY
jgi:hypothetical protein